MDELGSMRIAALYDVHGNLPALEAVLDEVGRAGVDAIVVGGDVVPGPMPRECLERLRASAIPVEYIHGNGESAVLDVLRGGAIERVPEVFRSSIRWCAEQLTPELVAWLATWPATIHLDVTGIGDTLFCHATPRNDTEVFTRLSPDEWVRPMFAGVTAPLAVCGHTHMAFDRRLGALRIVNAGSVGMPFGPPGAYWARLGPDVEFRHTLYDLQIAATRIRLTSYPEAESFVSNQVLHPRSEQDVLAAYARVDGR
ncbi:MAG: metallophosphoesterase family protein [Gemmatimonadaceae bacterium]|nr:metallophosphoesterase family protein [Gemmatimonadaceae bacterium]